MLNRILFNLTIASEAILANKLRAVLTALGIIFGVAAVIAMLAVGNGAQKEILEQIKLVGVNNIVITPVIEQPESGGDKKEGKEEKKKFSPGLTLADVKAIQENIPGISAISPEVVLETNMVKDGRQFKSKLVGVTPAYFDLINLKVLQGRLFNELQVEQGAPVCVIGQGIRAKFFSQTEPVGSRIKCGNHWLTVVGVLESRSVSESAAASLGIRNYDMDVYMPVTTALVRYANRSVLTKAMIQKAQMDEEEEKKEPAPQNYHQLDRLVVQIKDTDKLTTSAEVIGRLLQRRHLGVTDYEVSIPELLLKQQQRTKDIFNVVLGVIAGISLVVGGIGIMNIMLASVLERIKEIGLRISLGAKKTDIVLQFMCEAVLISVSGGLIGIALGVALAVGISKVADIPTIVSGTSIVLSFFVAASVGLIFGIAPARRAAEQDPITSLRYE